MGEGPGDPRIQTIRDLAIRLAGSAGADPAEPGAAGDDLDQALAALQALEEKSAPRLSSPDATSRIDELLGVVLALVSFDYTKKASISDRNDTFDGMAAGLNMLGEELSISTVSRTFLNDILESMSDLLMVIDPSGSITTVNRSACALSGYAREELIGQPLGLILSDVSPRELIESGGVTQHEKTCSRKGGGAVPVSFSASVLRDAQDTIMGLVCVARDLTERRLLDEEQWRLREAVHRQSVILEELSTPLIPITREILALPLIGTLDEQRATRMTEALLHAIVSQRARVAIIDITGVRTMDTAAVHGIIRAVQAVRMIGAEVVLTGIRPDVAVALVSLDVDLSRVVTFGSLQHGITYAMERVKRVSGS